MTCSPRISLSIATVLAGLALTPLTSSAESARETPIRVDIATGFTRFERAWAAYQLKATSAQYDAGLATSAAAAPALPADLFSPYRLSPPLQNARLFALVVPSGTNARVCATVSLQNRDQLSGFVAGMHAVGASVVAADCLTPASINSALAFPVQISAAKPVAATRAQALISKDAAERAAQTAVSGTVTFGLPSGNLLDFTATVGASSGPQGAALGNASGALWSLMGPVVDGPFTASYAGCNLVGPGGSCGVYVTFAPTSVGKLEGHVSITTDTGVTLVLRLNGTAAP